MLSCGIIGLPLSGKSTVFNIITRAGAEVKPYAGGKTDPNKSRIDVPDVRFDKLVEMFIPKSRVPAQVEFVDLAGLSSGASRGEGLGNSFLSFVQDADALLHVIRGFPSGDVPHPEGSLDVKRDFEIVNQELILSDLQKTESRLKRLESKKKPTSEEFAEKQLLDRISKHLFDEKPLSSLGMSQNEIAFLRGFAFLTLKPQLVILNLHEDHRSDSDVPGLQSLRSMLTERGVPAMTVYGRIEMEILELAPEEAAEFLEDLGITSSARERLISAAYSLLGLISFFTVGPDEVRAWTMSEGGNAVVAAGKIHSDIARGFIRAQIIRYEDLMKLGSMHGCREKGLLRLEGKDYIMKDGDVVEFRFNV